MKLKVNNNWEYLTYLFKGKKIPEQNAGTALIEWPNKDKEEIDYWSERKYVTYDDMGHTYGTYQHKLLFHTNHNGLVLTIPLTEVDIIKIHPNQSK